MPDAATGNGGTVNGAPPALRRAILVRLRQGGPASPDEIATAIGASRSGVVQQLRGLEAARLVAHRTVRHGVGRPRHIYDVTPDAQDLFPSNYDSFASGLLSAILEVGGEELLEAVFEARRRQAGERARAVLGERLPNGASLAERVTALASLQDEQGYLARTLVGPDGELRLVEHNCAIFHVATGSTAACDAELAFFRDVLGADVERESHIAAGDRCCTYRVAPLPDA